MPRRELGGVGRRATRDAPRELDEQVGEVTEFLNAVSRGDAGAGAALIQRICSDLRGIAREKLTGRGMQSLPPTDLVHQADLRVCPRTRSVPAVDRPARAAAQRGRRDRRQIDRVSLEGPAQVRVHLDLVARPGQQVGQRIPLQVAPHGLEDRAFESDPCELRRIDEHGAGLVAPQACLAVGRD